MRVFLTMMLGLLMSGCSAKSYNPEAHVGIHASAGDQAIAIEATKSFGHRNGFEVFASNDMPRGNRLVAEVLLKRADGVMLSMSNFMRSDVLETFIYAKKPDADWCAVKAAWLEEMRAALNGRGEIVEVPVGPPPSFVEEERKRREAAKSEDR